MDVPGEEAGPRADAPALVENETVAAAIEPESDRTREIVRDWFDRCIRNSPVSRNVEAFNHMLTAVEDLVAAIKEG